MDTVPSVDFIGRDDPVRTLRERLSGEGLSRPASIIGISGPGGIGKSLLLEHALRGVDLQGRKYLSLRLSGAGGARTLGQLVCHDLLKSCTQLDAFSGSYFAETRKNLEALRTIDERARAEVESATTGDTALRQTVVELFRLGVGLQAALPELKKHVDLSRIKEAELESAIRVLERAKAYQAESRLLAGIFPDLLGSGRRNRLRANPQGTIADGLIADLSAILTGYRTKDIAKPAAGKEPSVDRLLLVVDDFESLSDALGSFLGEHFVPMLSRASFESVLVVVGRDRLTDTHPVWRQQHHSLIAEEIRLRPFSEDEATAYLAASGISEPLAVERILRDTARYPYLLVGAVEAELDGGGSALSLKSFFDRTTRWMTPRQRKWLVPLCFLEHVNEETIRVILPDDDPTAVLEWFKAEPSVRSPSASRWEILPIIRSKITAYVKLDSPRRYRELSELAERAPADSGS